MKVISLIIIAFFVVFITAGYLLSDDIYYREIIKTDNLTTPEKVFAWAVSTYGNHPGIVHTNASPKHLMIRHRDLYCDEGAIVMATLDHKLGYKTRLLDFIGPDSIAHHTILQVYDHNKWINADFTTRTYNSTLTSSADKLKINLQRERIKPYPRLYNFVINNNFFVKKLAFAIRGINENGQ